METHCILAGEEGFGGNELDTLWAAGYYRTQHLLFTCYETQAHEGSYSIPVFWLRSRIGDIKEQKQATTIRKKCAVFTVQILPAFVSNEVEELYQLYRNYVPFSTSETCKAYLHQDFPPNNPFESYMVEVRDKDTLIAVGFFDKGAKAIAGIMNMYHPKYHAYSLGKFLMLQKLDFARANHIVYYYTGYISTAITRFDYKVFPDVAAVDVYLPVERKWVPYQFMDKEFLNDYYLNNLV